MKMIVISLDAVGEKDIDLLKQNECVRKLFEEGASCCNVKSVYPSLTYPAHASIITGRYPKNHGVINNTLVQKNRISSPDWMWQRKYVKGTTLYDEVLKKKKTVASLFWPVTAKSKITYCMPEVLPNRPWQNQLGVSFSNGSPLYEMELFARFRNELDGIKQPNLDNFTFKSCIYTLEKYQPDLMLIHFTDVDTMRHLHGVHSNEANEAIKRHGLRIEKICDKLKSLNLFEETVIVILGDHYQRDTNMVYYPNYYLKREGLLDDAICHEADGSAYVYVRNIEMVPSVKKLFYGLMADGECGIEKIYSGEEAEKKGADGRCAIMLEAKQGCYFKDEWENPFKKCVRDDKKMMFATHGYDPETPGYRTFFMIRGEKVKRGYNIKEMSLVDEASIFAKLWNVSLGKVDGRDMNEIFVEGENK